MERAQKRRKATKACDNCRRQKSRCEWNARSDESPDGGCHRCRVLSQTCTIDGQPLTQDTNHVPSHEPGPSDAPTYVIPKESEALSYAESSEREGSPPKYQPSFHEWLHSLENSESFFTALGKIAWGTPMAMLARLTAWHDRRPFTSDTGKDPMSAGILSDSEVEGLLNV